MVSCQQIHTCYLEYGTYDIYGYLLFGHLNNLGGSLSNEIACGVANPYAEGGTNACAKYLILFEPFLQQHLVQ